MSQLNQEKNQYYNPLFLSCLLACTLIMGVLIGFGITKLIVNNSPIIEREYYYPSSDENSLLFSESQITDEDTIISVIYVFNKDTFALDNLTTQELDVLLDKIYFNEPAEIQKSP